MPTHHKGDTQQVLALDSYIKLTRCVNALNARLSGGEVIGDLTMSQFGVLETLMHLGPLSQSEICAKLLRSGGNITLVIDNLEKRGLVKRTVDNKDRRITCVSLTHEGDTLIKTIFPLQAQAITEEMSVLSAAELEQLGALCKKLGKK
jgi:MarR family transcriptional regulator, 2-MHQ and catechol-resistance regulon repressor